MLSIHPQARTTPAVRLEIARSPEPTGVLAQRFGVSTKTGSGKPNHDIALQARGVKLD
jgi:hypothetical protein